MTESNEIERCGCLFVHEDAVRQVLGGMPDDETLYDLAELCVCDISKLLGLTQSAVSHQLRVLKGSRLVKFRREGKTVFYSLADDHVRKIIAQGMEHVNE